MKAPARMPQLFAAVLAICTLTRPLAAADPIPAKTIAKVYGEWRILIKPEKGSEYDALIQHVGLPLFREAGGRMVGWWKSLVGNLYEHVTIWEYDDMSGFERAIGLLGKDKRFADFVARRDPLLAGEQNRFLRLAPSAAQPLLSDPSKIVIHEVHHVALHRMSAYLDFMTKTGLPMLQRHGFRPVGPWTVDVGNWNDVTYLFRFDSLAERSALIARFAAHEDSKSYGDAMSRFLDGIETRVLTPAPFAIPSAKMSTADPVSSRLLPHLSQIGEGVFAAGFADRFQSANCGWVVLRNETLLIDLPRGVPIAEFCSEVERCSGKPIRRIALTSFSSGDEAILSEFFRRPLNEVIASPVLARRISEHSREKTSLRLRTLPREAAIGDESTGISFLPLDPVSSRGAAAVIVSQPSVLFAGPLVYNGPRAPLAGSHTKRWIAALAELESHHPLSVVPGFGSWGEKKLLSRQRRFLSELRRQVMYAVSQGRSEGALKQEVRIPSDYLVWMPYDTPTADDLSHVYREITVPNAPFDDDSPRPNDPLPHAFVLVGDQPHEPGHVIDALQPLFAEANIVPHFCVDVRALTAENLAKVQLLVILRDGLQRPADDAASHYVWMTMAQQEAVVRFVEKGGGFLNLHNSMGLYPDKGPYLNLVGGRYIGHGPLERFRVEVVDAHHPITRGVDDFWTADEQHTPPYDAHKVHLLLRNRSDDGKTVAAAGWCYEPGRGRLCHLANGHTRESLQHPTYRRLMRNALFWCLHRKPQ